MTHTTEAAAIRVHRRRPFAVAPMDIVIDSRVTRSDRCVLIYLLGLSGRPGWTIYVAEVQRTMHLSDAGWRACRRRLEAAGYYRAHKVRVAGGRWQWIIDVTDTPDSWNDDAGPSPVPSTPCVATDGDTTHRGAAHRSDVDRRSSTHARSTDISIPTQQHARVEHAAAWPQKKEFERRGSGIETWGMGDRAAAQAIEEEHAPEVIAAAVTSIREKNQSAVPGRVRAEIDHQARARHDAEARKADAEALARHKVEKERRRALRAANPLPRLDQYIAALNHAGTHRDAVMRSVHQANGTPATWIPQPEWGLSAQDVVIIRAYIPDRAEDD